MQIRIRATGAVMFESEFRQLHADTSFPQQLTQEVLDRLDADVVFEGPQATPTTPYQYSQRDGVEQIDGKWYTKYTLGPVFADTPEATAAQQEAEYKARKDAEQAANVRATRNAKLAETDWVVIKALESNAPQDFEVAAKRQALRDITAQAGFPWEVVWPE